MRPILLSLLACFCFCVDPPSEVKLPPDAAKIVADHDAQVAAAKRACEAACAKADAEAVKKLDTVLVKVTKSGDLAWANAVKSKVDAYKTKPANNDDLLGDGGIKVAGIYKVVTGGWSGITNVTIDEKKGFKTSSKNDYGTWSIKGTTVTLTWQNGHTTSGDWNTAEINLTGDGNITLIRTE